MNIDRSAAVSGSKFISRVIPLLDDEFDPGMEEDILGHDEMHFHASPEEDATDCDFLDIKM